MSIYRTELEKSLGCLESSTIFPVAALIKQKYIEGADIDDLVKKYGKYGISKTQISNYINKNQFERINSELETQSPVKEIEIPVIHEEMISITPKEELSKKSDFSLFIPLAEGYRHEKEKSSALVGLLFCEGQTILEQSGGCWFPVGPEPSTVADQLFCAKPVLKGYKFCEHHKRIAFI